MECETAEMSRASLRLGYVELLESAGFAIRKRVTG